MLTQLTFICFYLVLYNILLTFAYMNNKKKLSEDELKWRAEEDARTLERYQEIMNDKPRLEAAMEQAKKTVDNLQERANALSKSLTGLNTK